MEIITPFLLLRVDKQRAMRWNKSKAKASFNARTFLGGNGGFQINKMKTKNLMLWFSTTSFILILFGLTYTFFGLKILPVSNDVLLQWESALYGAIMTGWGVTLFLVGRIAFRKNDGELLKTILYGLIVWLVLEAALSVYLHVWFNVGVDIAVAVLFIYPIAATINSKDNKK
ncbi:MAG: hypothetical protein M1428_00920 [Deltaproteobacteria bacterium]|nr:hypothetical protein [Deltaproteobacteria bacterium]